MVCQLKTPDFLIQRPGKSAALVSKKFGLQQPAGNRRAIYLNEGALAAWAEVVNRARDQFLAGARLTQNQSGGIGRSHHFYL